MALVFQREMSDRRRIHARVGAMRAQVVHAMCEERGKRTGHSVSLFHVIGKSGQVGRQQC